MGSGSRSRIESGKGIVIAWKDWVELLSIGLALTFVVGLLEGSYPSFFLSRFQPALVLKGHFTSQLKASFTKPLVVLQFFFSASLIICSVTMYRQMKFVATKNLGYNKDQTLVVQTQLDGGIRKPTKSWHVQNARAGQPFTLTNA